MSVKSGEKKSTSWVLVMFILIGFPLLMALTLNFWLGVPTEKQPPDEIFARLNLDTVRLVEHQAFQYGPLFFAKFRVVPDDFPEFQAQLSGFQSRQGPPEKPVALKLERDWWDVDPSASGTTYERGPAMLWSPESRPDLFYATVDSN